MGIETLTIVDIEIEKYSFYCHKSPIFLEDVDNEKVLVSSKIPSGEKSYKYFLGYFYDYKVKPLDIILAKSSAYVKRYDEQTKLMFFF